MQAITRKQLTSGLGRSALLARPAMVMPARAVSTESMDSRQAMDLLNQQRAKRPSSPWHIYQPQLTSATSIANRVTGSGLSVAFYAVFLSHVMAPAFGATIDSAALVDAFASLPGWFATSLKAAVAAAGSFHTFNGLRHLAWDTGYFLDLKTSYMAGYAVLGATALSTAALLAL
ncbi:hypothetical protein JCM10908_005536 [Rhodotorula pacifica]|uniref:succinate:quinone oxidoreductase subunit C n=1 Tax=Rhodotorula pacifica TaxID=1495444 RepID=UPI00317D78F2